MKELGILTHTWAMEPRQLEAFLGTLTDIVPYLSLDLIAQDMGLDSNPPAGPGYYMQGRTAVVPIEGVILKGVPIFLRLFGFEVASIETIRAGISGALEDVLAQDILLSVDSPGGEADGINALADEIYAARSRKPIRAHIGSQACSAAYWLASQAQNIVADPSARVGSIGIYTVIRDTSAAAEKAGVKVHVISSGGFKGSGVMGAPIDEGYMKMLRQYVSDMKDIFVASIARGRGIPNEALDYLADGSLWIADKASDLGLIDATGPALIISTSGTVEAFTAQDGGESWRAISYSRHGDKPKADKAASWDAGAEVAAAKLADLKIMCALENGNSLDSKDGYKLPHHRQKDKAVIFRAVSAAIAAINGGRGGLKGVPDEEKRRAYNHLAKEYKRFDANPPEYQGANISPQGLKGVKMTEQEVKVYLSGLSAEDFATICPADLLHAAENRGAEQERLRIEEYLTTFEDDVSFALDAYRSKKAIDAARLEFAEKRRTDAEQRAEGLQKQLDEVKGGVPFVASDSEAAEKARQQGNDTVAKIESKLAEYMQDGKMSRAKAVDRLAHEEPELHKAWIVEVNK